MRWVTKVVIVAASALALALAANGVGHAPLVARLAAPAAQETAPRDVLVRRDRWGVPHVRGATDADAAYGLAWAHAEDDFPTIQEVMAATRGRSGELTGRRGAAQDYAYHLLRVREGVEARDATDLSPSTRAVVEAYAAGLNRYAADHPSELRLRGLFPVTGEDIVAGFALTSPFFFGLDRVLGALHAGEPLPRETGPATERGSNAFAVAPSRSADGATRLLLNSHQPWSGPVAWYEAHVASGEGLDFAGAVFPGSPVPLNGHNGVLGWANTINRPDLIDVYRLTLSEDGERYRFDGKWLPLERRRVWLKVRFGPIVLPVPQTVRRSVHGPVMVNRAGAYAIRYAGMGEIRQVEQYLRLAKARSYEAWLAAMRMQAVPATNFIYADRTGRIGLFYNAKFPRRAPGFDWRGVLPGDTSRAVWTGYEPFDAGPRLIDPAAGFLANANNTPFVATEPASDLRPSDYSPLLGIEGDMTNRMRRAVELMKPLPKISADDLWRVKMDTGFSPDSVQMRFVQIVIGLEANTDREFAAAQALLAEWDGNLDGVGRADALAALFLHPVNRARYTRRPLPDPRTALSEAAAFLRQHHGRLDPPLGSLLRLRRGELDLPLTGGPDVLRAIGWEPSRHGRLIADFGDAYIMEVTWDADGRVAARSVHQFGAATSRPHSRHYADQSPLFVRGELRPAWFSEAELAPNARCAYRPGAPRVGC